MIAYIMKNNQILRFLLLLGVSLMTTLVLISAAIAIHAQGFAAFLSAHAMDIGSTCASTKGTQSGLCEQQNPVTQLCTRDAQSIAVESVYHQNTLLGEVDLRHSATCKTYWVRTIASVNAVSQVQAVDAIISFHNGKLEDKKETDHTAGQPLVAFTDMMYQPGLFPTVSGVFHLSGQTPPITIPLLGYTLISSADTMDTGKTVVQAQTQTLCASAPTPQHCDNQDPVTQGCDKDAQTLAYEEFLNQQGAILATLQRRYSPTCHSEWGRILDDGKQPLNIIIGKNSRSTPGNIAFSTMVFVPTLSVAPAITGIVSTNGIDSLQVYGRGQEGILPALPAAQK